MEKRPITGSCGENLTFQLLDGILHIEGTGRLMRNSLWGNFVIFIPKITKVAMPLGSALLNRK